MRAAMCQEVACARVRARSPRLLADPPATRPPAPPLRLQVEKLSPRAQEVIRRAGGWAAGGARAKRVCGLAHASMRWRPSESGDWASISARRSPSQRASPLQTPPSSPTPGCRTGSRANAARNAAAYGFDAAARRRRSCVPRKLQKLSRRPSSSKGRRAAPSEAAAMAPARAGKNARGAAARVLRLRAGVDARYVAMYLAVHALNS